MFNQISVNTQNSIRIEVNPELVLYCDPFEIQGEPHDGALILITHDHFDHFSPEAIAKVAKEDTLFVCPQTMAEALAASGIEPSQITAVTPGQTLTMGDLPIETVPAYNTRKSFHPEEKGWVGYILTVNGQRIYIAGDTNFIPEQRDITCDIAMVPIGGYYTMDAREAAACVNKMKPKVVIPTHYGTIVGHPSEGQLFKKFINDGIEVVFKLFE